MKALIILAILTVASSEKQNQLQHIDPFSLLDRHIAHTFNYLWPWSKLVKMAASLEDNSYDEPQYISNKEKLEVRLNVKHFKPEELRVRVNHRNIIVEGQHTQDHDESVIANQFEQRFVLPAGSKPEEVSAELNEQGILVVTVPKHPLPPPPPERQVPIKIVLLPTNESDKHEVYEKKTEKPKKATKFTKTTETPSTTVKIETPIVVTLAETSGAAAAADRLTTSTMTPLEETDATAATKTFEKLIKLEEEFKQNAQSVDAPFEQLQMAESIVHGKIKKKELKEKSQM